MAKELMLAIDTSSLQGSVALARDGAVCAVRRLTPERRHTTELLPVVQDILTAEGWRLADITLFAYSCGPGSFTGVRVAATVGRMLQSMLDCQVVAAPTLEVIAENTSALSDPPKRLAVILDARRGQVYGGLFERQGGELMTVIPAGLFEPGPWLAGLGQPLWITGGGNTRHAEAVAQSGGVVLEEEYWTPRAENVAVVGWRLASAGKFCRPEEILPLYVRRPECEEVYEERRTTARNRRGE